MKKIIRLPAGVTEFVIGMLPFFPNQTVKISVESSEGQLKHTIGYTDALGQISIALNTLPLVGWFVRTMDYYIFRAYDMDNNPLTVLEIADNAIMADELYVYFSDAPSASQYFAVFRDWVGCKPVISNDVSPVYIPTPRIEITGGAKLDGNDPPLWEHDYQIRVWWADCQDKRFLEHKPEVWEFRYKTKRTSKKKNILNPSGPKLTVLVPSKWAPTYHLCNVGGMRPRKTKFSLKKLSGVYVLPEKDVYLDVAHNYTERKFYRNNAVNISPNFNSLFNYTENSNISPIPRGQHRRSTGISGRFNEYFKYAIVIKIGESYYMSEMSSETVQLGHNRKDGRYDMPICRFGK